MTVAAVAAATFTVTVPTGTSFAINKVYDYNCKVDDGFLKVWIRKGNIGWIDCFANAGKTSEYGWLDRIVTGNNDVTYYDQNGATVYVPRWTDLSFPNRPADIKAIEIH
ncbi:beta/gamma crystallin domain-containing protein [Amycolatopsis minnesotensis]|uniref:Streptomyces killer toxin-like beta/gamma crystallin domain-containing protein n=1 Tax=Amycolatopsis minnesotensis TaxID=337894 RepID=A0ABN2Q790_9PSEU